LRDAGGFPSIKIYEKKRKHQKKLRQGLVEAPSQPWKKQQRTVSLRWARKKRCSKRDGRAENGGPPATIATNVPPDPGGKQTDRKRGKILRKGKSFGGRTAGSSEKRAETSRMKSVGLTNKRGAFVEREGWVIDR